MEEIADLLRELITEVQGLRTDLMILVNEHTNNDVLSAIHELEAAVGGRSVIICKTYTTL